MSQSELPPRIWHPTEMLLVLESDPGDGEIDPNAWIDKDEEGRTSLAHWWTPEHCAYARPLADGDEVEMTWSRCWGHAKLPIAADDTWTVDRQPPPQTNVIWFAHDCYNETFDGLVRTLRRLHCQELEAERPQRQDGEDAENFADRQRAWEEMLAAAPGAVPVTYIEAWGRESMVFRADPPRFEAM